LSAWRLRAALAVAALGLPGAISAQGLGLFEALERAPVSLVGRVGAPRALDDQAFGVEIEVESVLQGPLSRGARLSLAWEELSPARPARFAAGERLLVCLEPLPAHSIWAVRIPDPELRARTLTLASRGEAFVRDPRPGSLRLLEHYLALPAERRAGDPGVAHLALLAAGARTRLAVEAVAQLARVPDLDVALDPASAERLVAVLVGEDDELGDAVLGLLRTRRPAPLRPALARLATDDGAGPARAYAGLAALDGSLPATLAGALLARDDSPAHRRIGARHADASLHSRLPRLLRADPDPGVRAAALERLVESDGLAALDRVLFALDDEDASVRATAMQAIGGLGEPAVPELRAVVEHGSLEAARTAVGALQACGDAGARALREIADSHPDPSLRLLAQVAIGRPIGHRH